MKQKKLMLLGGLRYLIPVIEAAHKLGLYVITCDYLPDNIAHKYSDEYRNVSIIDKEAVLKVARELEIDGIMSFAVDPGVVTAAYVAEQMGLPFAGSYEAVRILQNKDLFRNFLREHGFNCPWSYGFASVEEVIAASSAFSYPAIVKPTDAAGSKGVSRVDSISELEKAVNYAFKYSISGRIIIEEFLEKKGCSSDTDSFSIDGKLAFVSFSAQRFDESATNPYTPSAYSWPSTFSAEEEAELAGEIQRLITLLNLKTSIYNIETRVATNGKAYIMEMSPRGGGNRLAEVLRMATGVDLITAAVAAAVNEPTDGVAQKNYNGHWAEVILHSDTDGHFESLYIAQNKESAVQEKDLWINMGDKVVSFSGANDAVGTLILKFDSPQDLESAISNQASWLKVCVSNLEN